MASMTQPLNNAEMVVLIHGIWMHGIELRLLGRRLCQSGYQVSYFKYFSMMRSPHENVSRLVARLQSIEADKLHIVAHSLGGLIAMQAVRSSTVLPQGRVVLIGTPAQGSDVARRIASWHLGWMLGKNHAMLTQAAADWDLSRQLGTIAGTMDLGLGLIFGGIAGASDGTVAEAETHVKGQADHLIVHSSHFGMLFRHDVAGQVSAFLREGRFMPPSQQ